MNHGQHTIDRIRKACRTTTSAYFADPQAAMPFDIIPTADILWALDLLETYSKITRTLAQHLADTTAELEDTP